MSVIKFFLLFIGLLLISSGISDSILKDIPDATYISAYDPNGISLFIGCILTAGGITIKN